MLVIGINDTRLDDQDRRRLAAPEVSGVILFARNYTSREQLQALVAEIRVERAGPFLICVDQEGGPVQRFREGFTRLPALARIGELYARDPAEAEQRAEEHAWVMASEIRATGVDLSFAPVADLARGNRAIGERALHADAEIVSDLLLAYMRGMHLAGMAVTLKHFPGHGSVAEDTHVDAAEDPRTLEVLRASDLRPFIEGIRGGAEVVMMGHVRYPAVDSEPAGYSRVWIQDILRGNLGFEGLVISDDIGMAAAKSAGDVAARVDRHLQAGCDLILACEPAQVDEAIRSVRGRAPCGESRIVSLRGAATATFTWRELVENPQRDDFIARVRSLEQSQSHG